MSIWKALIKKKAETPLEFQTKAPRRLGKAKQRKYMVDCDLLYNGTVIRVFKVEVSAWSRRHAREKIEVGYSIKPTRSYLSK